MPGRVRREGDVVRDEGITVRLPLSLEAVLHARERLRALPSSSLSPAEAAELQLLVGELVINAVRHARRSGEIRLCVDLLPDRVRVEVHDPGPGFSLARPIRRPRVSELHGRGLLMVDGLAARWGNARTDGGHCAWFELDRARPI